jgi:methylmalonyl-CoA mutase
MSRSEHFHDFPPVNPREWKQQIQVGLKGEDYNETLVWESPDQIKVKPFYSREDLPEGATFGIPSPENWEIGQAFTVTEVGPVNELALKALERGAESLFFFGATRDIDLQGLLRGIDLDKVAVHLQLPWLSDPVLEDLRTLRKKAGSRIFLHFDVIGNLARTGNWQLGMKQDLSAYAKLGRELEGMFCLSADATLYQNAGANRIQQLAYALSHAHEYMHLLSSENKGKDLPKVVFRLAVDSNYFFEMAKIRALRLLWSTLAREYGAPEDCHIIAEPSRRNKTLYEYNANMLRTTMECMAAVNGGADMVVNLPYDDLFHHRNEFGDRLSRNQLLILKEESYMGAVANPADGAYYIETLTAQLAEKALSVFKTIEASGGFLSALKSHTIQKKIREQAAKEQALFDEGASVLVGTNAYKNPDDIAKDRLEVSPFVERRSEKTLIEPILARRLAEPVEKKRMKDE